MHMHLNPMLSALASRVRGKKKTSLLVYYLITHSKELALLLTPSLISTQTGDDKTPIVSHNNTHVKDHGGERRGIFFLQEKKIYNVTIVDPGDAVAE